MRAGPLPPSRQRKEGQQLTWEPGSTRSRAARHHHDPSVDALAAGPQHGLSRVQKGTGHGQRYPVLVHGKAAPEHRSCTSARDKIEDGRKSKHQISSNHREFGAKIPSAGLSWGVCQVGSRSTAFTVLPDKGTRSVMLHRVFRSPFAL